MIKQRATTEFEKAQRREKLLDAAIEIFFQKGFHATRLEDIAKQAGLSKGTLYLYFENKESIFLALIERLALSSVHKLTQHLQDFDESEQSIEKIFSGLFDEIIYILVDTQLPKLIKIMIGDSQNFPVIVQHYKQNIIDVALSQLALFLEKAHQKKLLNVPEPIITAQIIISPFILSVLMQVLFFGEDKQADRARVQALLKIHQKMLINYLTVAK